MIVMFHNKEKAKDNVKLQRFVTRINKNTNKE